MPRPGGRGHRSLASMTWRAPEAPRTVSLGCDFFGLPPGARRRRQCALPTLPARSRPRTRHWPCAKIDSAPHRIRQARGRPERSAAMCARHAKTGCHRLPRVCTPRLRGSRIPQGRAVQAGENRRAEKSGGAVSLHEEQRLCRCVMVSVFYRDRGEGPRRPGVSGG